MAQSRRAQMAITWNTSSQDRDFLQAMATDVAADDRSQKRALLVLRMLGGEDLAAAARTVGMGRQTARKVAKAYNTQGWKALLTVQPPRGGDFLARYDQGYWAERLTKRLLDQCRNHRAIPYGTSRSEPFTDLEAFREYAVNEFLLQAWSAEGRWKRPDLLTVPRGLLVDEKGNDEWTPDLKHFSNDQCAPYVKQAGAAVEVETSLWQVKRATVPLSFTVKDEDLAALRSWVKANTLPLYIIQVFYDEAFALPFSRLEHLITLDPSDERHVAAEVDRTTKKATYKVPLGEGVRLGLIPEPDVEGRVFKAPNGRVTVYGRLTGSAIVPQNQQVIEDLTGGVLN